MNGENIAAGIRARLVSSSGSDSAEGPPPVELTPPRVPDHEMIRRVGSGNYVRFGWRVVLRASSER